MIAATDARLDAVVDLLLGFPKGLSIDEIATKLGMSYWVARKTTQVLGAKKRAVVVHLGNGAAVWVVPRYAKQLRANLAEASRLNTARRQRELRAANGRAPSPRAKLYERPGVDLDNIPDLPIIRRVVSTWAPVRVPPGPTSVFALGGA